MNKIKLGILGGGGDSLIGVLHRLLPICTTDTKLLAVFLTQTMMKT